MPADVIEGGDRGALTPDKLAQHVIPQKDTYITVPGGVVESHGEGERLIKAGQPVPLAFLDAYKAEVGESQFKKETQDRTVSPILQVHTGTAKAVDEKDEED